MNRNFLLALVIFVSGFASVSQAWQEFIVNASHHFGPGPKPDSNTKIRISYSTEIVPPNIGNLEVQVVAGKLFIEFFDIDHCPTFSLSNYSAGASFGGASIPQDYYVRTPMTQVQSERRCYAEISGAEGMIAAIDFGPIHSPASTYLQTPFVLLQDGKKTKQVLHVEMGRFQYTYAFQLADPLQINH